MPKLKRQLGYSYPVCCILSDSFYPDGYHNEAMWVSRHNPVDFCDAGLGQKKTRVLVLPDGEKV